MSGLLLFKYIGKHTSKIVLKENEVSVFPEGEIYGERINEYFLKSNLSDTWIFTFDDYQILWVEKNAIEDFKWKGTLLMNDIEYGYAPVFNEKNEMTFIPNGSLIEILEKDMQNMISFLYNHEKYITSFNYVEQLLTPSKPLLIRIISYEGIQVHKIDNDDEFSYSLVQSKLLGIIPYHSTCIISHKAFIPFCKTSNHIKNIRVWFLKELPGCFIVDDTSHFELVGYTHLSETSSIKDYNLLKIIRMDNRNYFTTEPDRPICLYCYHNEAVYAVYHQKTAHRILCHSCFSESIQIKSCPICRQDAESIVQIF